MYEVIVVGYTHLYDGFSQLLTYFISFPIVIFILQWHDCGMFSDGYLCDEISEFEPNNV